MSMLTILFALFGFVIGVLVNRAADNFTCQRPFLAAPQCPNCATARSVPDQSELVRYLLHRNSCVQCGAAVRWIPLILELASAAAFAYLWVTFGATITLALAIVYTIVFLLVLIIDFQHRLIPNVIMLPAIALALLASPLSSAGVNRSLLGGGTTFAIVLMFYLFGKVFEKVRGYHIKGGAFGQGDVTLASFVGIVTGFPAAFTAILYAVLLGGVGAIAFLIFHGVAHRRLALDKPIPYGPFFCIAGWLIMVTGAW